MNNNFELMDFQEDGKPNNFIKVIGVGGGGGNAVNHMYEQGIKDVDFVVCNTDNQDLLKSKIQVKVQLGKELTSGLGAGAKPEIGKQAAEESQEEIRQLLSDNTKMVFVTAGMGGGTGTGAAPIIAGIAKSLNKLTVGIVTIPFEFEGQKKIKQALLGVEEMSKNVDALLVINNAQLIKIYPDLVLGNAFQKADDILTEAAKSIAEIITITGYINVDFADVSTIMRESGVAVMNTGIGQGENRVTKAIQNALTSPLLRDNNIKGTKRLLINMYTSKEHECRAEETTELHAFVKALGEDIDFIWGATYDESLGESIKITLVATGFSIEKIPSLNEENSNNKLPEFELPDNSNNQSENTQEILEDDDIITIDEWDTDDDDFDFDTPPSLRNK